MRKRRRVVVDFATPPVERGQHDVLEVVNHDPQNAGARRVQLKMPNRLRKYVALKSISHMQAEAGEALAADWHRAGLIQRTIPNLDRTSGGYQSISDVALDARARVVKALAGDRKPYADLLVSVCCYDAGVANTRRLSRALTALGIHYGLIRRQA